MQEPIGQLNVLPHDIIPSFITLYWNNNSGRYKVLTKILYRKNTENDNYNIRVIIICKYKLANWTNYIYYEGTSFSVSLVLG
jgi:hypothetical protein